MKYLYILSVVALASARPEAGYNYPQPAPQPQFQPQPQPQPQPALVYLEQAGPAPGPSFAAPQPSYHAPAPQPSYHAPAPQPSYQSPAPSYHGSFAPAQAPRPSQLLVTKDIYVHVAPESPHEELASPPQPPQIARKHYKIIFIKAPQSQVNQQLAAAVPPQNEEKTIVYVLVKKPEQLQLDSPPAELQRPPSKPEVYFIKYRANQAEASAHGPAPGPASGPEGALVKLVPAGPAPQQSFHSAPQPSAGYKKK